MKTLLRLLVGLGLAACVASARAELSAVSFAVGKQQFKTGDSIVIDQVIATSAKIQVGATVVVRGHYHLTSMHKACLVLSGSRQEHQRVLPSHTAAISRGAGTFELSYEVKTAGTLRVSLYPLREVMPHEPLNVTLYPGPTGEEFGHISFRQR